MDTAILVKGARNVVLDNVVIRGFSRGIVLENSTALLNRVVIAQSEIGLVTKRSYVTINQSMFLDNKIDILAENASLNLIDTIARKVLAYFSNITISHYAVNPYRIIAQAREVLKEQDPLVKRRKFRQLLKTLLQYAAYAKTIYDIIKIILKVAGISLP